MKDTKSIDELWEDYLEEYGDDMFFYGFNVGDKVTVKGSMLERTGTVKERNIDVFGEHEYVVAFGDDMEYFYEKDLELFRNNNKGCECGAIKTHGANCTKYHHSFWCALRGDADERK